MSLQDSAYVDVNPVIVPSADQIILAKRVADIVEGGKWHLPGGRVLFGEPFRTTLKRIAFNKTNLKIELSSPSLKDSLVGIYDDPNRDPREHVIGLAFLCTIVGGTAKPRGKVSQVRSFFESDIKDLEIAFDHRKMIEDAFAIQSRTPTK